MFMVDDKVPSIKHFELPSVIITVRGRLFAGGSKHVTALTIYKFY
jgi:hypothetical protein